MRYQQSAQSYQQSPPATHLPSRNHFLIPSHSPTPIHSLIRTHFQPPAIHHRTPETTRQTPARHLTRPTHLPNPAAHRSRPVIRHRQPSAETTTHHQTRNR
jgi:hypothetical protein